MKGKRMVVLAFLLFASAAVGYSYFVSSGEIYRSDSTGWTQSEANAEIMRFESEYDANLLQANAASEQAEILEDTVKQLDEAISKLGGGTPYAVQLLQREKFIVEREQSVYAGEAAYYSELAAEAKANQEGILEACQTARFACYNPGNQLGSG